MAEVSALRIVTTHRLLNSESVECLVDIELALLHVTVHLLHCPIHPTKMYDTHGLPIIDSSCAESSGPGFPSTRWSMHMVSDRMCHYR